jgi:peroxiredoxin Q/BCP
MNTTAPLGPGDPAPAFRLLDQHGQERTLQEFAGRPVLLYFYPKASTPGCTTQSCGMRDVKGDIGDAQILGVSPDPPERQARFDDKYGLGFPLLADTDHRLADAFGVWGEKKLYGRSYHGVVRSAFLIDRDGRIAAAFPRISPKDTPRKLLQALGQLPS